MEIMVLTRSRSLLRHLVAASGNDHRVSTVETAEELISRSNAGRQFALVHTSTYAGNTRELFEALSRNRETHATAAADKPNIEDMLALSQFGLRAYFNSYMADVHYRQMFRLVLSGQTWFPPTLLAQALELARRQSVTTTTSGKLSYLTSRERDVALAVAKGLSNKRVANVLGISERTVKTHLTRVFEKLGVDDRVSLAIGLNTDMDAAANDG